MEKDGLEILEDIRKAEFRVGLFTSDTMWVCGISNEWKLDGKKPNDFHYTTVQYATPKETLNDVIEYLRTHGKQI